MVVRLACWGGLIEVIAEAQRAIERESLAFEAQLHQQFDQWRKPEAEIFCFTPDQLEQVKKAMAQPLVTMSM